MQSQSTNGPAELVCKTSADKKCSTGFLLRIYYFFPKLRDRGTHVVYLSLSCQISAAWAFSVIVIILRSPSAIA